jgi:hypothetical protein
MITHIIYLVIIGICILIIRDQNQIINEYSRKQQQRDLEEEENKQNHPIKY